MENKSVTAVEFLIQQILKHDKSFIEFYNAEIQQAKEMEKQQIIDAHVTGHNASSSTIKQHDAEQYYNETYKKNNL